MIIVKHKGSLNRTTRFLHNVLHLDYKTILARYGRKGVEALKDSTPLDSGKTAESWRYEINEMPGGFAITWLNDNINKDVNIAIILRYGHGTGTGGYVAGRNYISPAIQPVFDEMANAVWKELNKR